MRTWLLSVVLLAVGCKKDDAPTCASTIETIAPRLVPLHRSDLADARLGEIRGKLTTALVDRCRIDRWPSAALDCMRKATSESEVRACSTNLRSAQVDAFVGVLANEALRAPRPPALAGVKPTGIAECDEYRAAVARLAACDAIPDQTRKEMLDAFDQAADAWGALPPEGKAAAATACKAATDATIQAAESCK